MSAASACIVMNEDGTIYQGAIANSDKVASIRRILGAYPVLLFGIVELEVVAFAGDQSALPEDTKVNQTQIKVLKELALRGKILFLKKEGDLLVEDFPEVRSYIKTLNLEAGDGSSPESELAEQPEKDESRFDKSELENGEEESSDRSFVEDEEVESGPGEMEEAEEVEIVGKFLDRTGPIVKAVLIDPSGRDIPILFFLMKYVALGELSEIQLDMTPAKDSVRKVLGGDATIIGQYEKGEVLLKLRNPPPNTKKNLAALPEPFDSIEVLGKILIIKMDEQAEPCNFTVKKFYKLSSKTTEEKAKEQLFKEGFESIQEIARAIGKANGEKIAKFYKKEIQALKNASVKDINDSLEENHRHGDESHVMQDLESSSKNENSKDSEGGTSDEDATDEEMEIHNSTSNFHVPSASVEDVSAILVKNGAPEEHTIDVSKISKLIGGPATVLGGNDQGVLIFKLRNPKPAQHRLNLVTLPPPFTDEQILGNFVIMRFDKTGVPKDFNLQDYEAFLSKAGKSRNGRNNQDSEEENSDSETDTRAEEDRNDIEIDKMSSLVSNRARGYRECAQSKASEQQGEAFEIDSDDEDYQELDESNQTESVDFEEELESDSEEFESCEDEDENVGDLLSLKKLVDMKGPVVNAVIIDQDGNVNDKTVDMTPSLNAISRILGGQATIVGQYHNGAVIMKLRDPMEELGFNVATLPFPFNSAKIKGKILIVRMDKNAEPQNLTKEEYLQMKSEAQNKHENYLSAISSASKALCIIVRHNGETWEDGMNLEEIKNILGGELEIAGQYPNLATVLKLRNPLSSTKHNDCILPEPLHEVSIKGSFAVIRVNKSINDNDLGNLKLQDFDLNDFVALRLADGQWDIGESKDVDDMMENKEQSENDDETELDTNFDEDRDKPMPEKNVQPMHKPKRVKHIKKRKRSSDDRSDQTKHKERRMASEIEFSSSAVQRSPTGSVRIYA